MGLFEITLFFGLPVLALLLGRRARSRTARRILVYGALYFLLSHGVMVLVSADCQYNEFKFDRCETLPQALADPYGVFGLMNLFVFLFVSPVLLLIAAICEARTRHEPDARL